MCEMLDKMEARGEARGLERGEEKGEVKMLASLVNKGKFTVQQAAEELALSAEAFIAKCEEYNFTI